VQGGKAVFLNSPDLVYALMIHKKLPNLRKAAGNTFVEVNSGAAAVMARVIQAAINPTEGQRMLQAGFDGEILGGESREKISTSSDVDGIVRVDRFVERSVVSEGGQAVLMQQVQQSAQQLPPMPDIEEPLPPSQLSGMVSKAEFQAGLDGSKRGIAGKFRRIQQTSIRTNKNVQCLVKLIDKHAKDTNKRVQCLERTVGGMSRTMRAKNQTMHDNCVGMMKAIIAISSNGNKTNQDVVELKEKTDKKFKDMEAKNAEREAERDAKQAEREAERDAKQAERDAERDAKQAERDAERDAKVVVEFEKRLALRQSEPSKKKRPANIQGESVPKKKTKKEEPRNFKKAGKYFQWFKTINGVKHLDKVGYKTLDEAKQGMASYFDNLEQQDNDMTESD